MSDYDRLLVIANKDEWVTHVDEVAKHKDGKTEEELLDEAFAFDFKFELIEP